MVYFLTRIINQAACGGFTFQKLLKTSTNPAFERLSQDTQTFDSYLVSLCTLENTKGCDQEWVISSPKNNLYNLTTNVKGAIQNNSKYW